MLNLPSSTEIKKPLPKKVIYDKFQLNTSQRKNMDNDMSRLVLVNEISTRTINITEGTEIKSIFVLSVMLKTDSYNEKNILMLFKLIPQKLVLVLNYDEQEKVIVYYKKKMLQTDWRTINKGTLNLQGLNLDEVWEQIIIQIGDISLEQGKTLEEQIKENEYQQKLEKKIVALEKRVYSEKQPKKKLALFNELQELKKQYNIKAIN